MAADRIFWFPSQTGSIPSQAGDIRIKIWYNDAGLGSPSNTNMSDCGIIKIGAIDFPFNITPSGTVADAEYRHASCEIVLENARYDATNNYFEQYSVLNSTYALETFVAIYKDGSEYWRGVIDFPQTKRFDYYLDGSTVKYRKVKLKLLDALYYLWSHDVDLSDVSYSDDIVIKTLIGNICSEVGYGSTDYDLDANLKITEYSGTEHQIWDMKIRGQTAGDQVSDWLKEFAVATGTYFFSLNGKINFVFLGNTGTAVALSTDDIKEKMERAENANTIEYVFYEADMNYGSAFMPAVYSGYAEAIEKTSGTESQDTTRNFSHDAVAILGFVFEGGTQGNYGSPPDTADSSTPTSLTLASGGFQTAGVESGDLVSIEYSSGVYTDHANYNRNSIVEDVPSETQVHFHSVVGSPSNNIFLITNYYNNRRRKTQKFAELIGQGYIDYFLTSPDILKVPLAGLSTYDDWSNKYTLGGNSYKIKAAKIDLMQDDILLELMRIA